MNPKLNLWLESNGDVVFSIWRMRLLQAVAETGSISAAAAVMNVQYRTAWQKINEMETGLGHKLVETKVGGRQGGGAELTAVAHQLVTAFNQFSTEMNSCLNDHFQTILAPALPPTISD